MSKIKISSITQLLRWAYSGYDEMVKRYPKSAKKARIRKKWINRFGRPLREVLYNETPFLALLPGTNGFGNHIEISLNQEGRE